MGSPARDELTPSRLRLPARPGSDLDKIRRALADVQTAGVAVDENVPIDDPPPTDADGGWVSWTDDSDSDAFGRAEHHAACSSCGGQGRITDALVGVCPACGGNGQVTVEADDERASDDLIGDLYLEFGADSDARAREVARMTVAALREHGLTARWNRNLAYSIRVVA